MTYTDWAAVGQRIVVVSPAGVQMDAVVQSASGVTIVVDRNLTAVALAGGFVMPAVGVFLDAEQTFERHPVNLARVDLVARAARNGYAGGAVGTGATVSTFDSCGARKVADLTQTGRPPVNFFLTVLANALRSGLVTVNLVKGAAA